MPPQYYNGADPVTSFTDGLARGFELVEGIRERRQMRELRERESARQDAALELQKNADARAQTSAELSNREAELRLGVLPTQLQQSVRSGQLSIEAAEAEAKRRPTVYKQEDERAADENRNRDQAYAVTEEARKNAREDRDTAQRGGQFMSELLLGGQPAQSPLTSVARTGVQQPGTAPQATPTNYVERRPVPGTPLAAGATTAPTDLDLRNTPTVGQRVLGAVAAPFKAFNKLDSTIGESMEGHGKKAAAAKWNAVAEGSLLHDAERQNPTRYAQDYLKSRDGVKPENRAKLDYTMTAALNDELKQLPPGPKSVTRAVEIQNQLKQLTAARVNDAPASVGIKKPVPATDPRIQQAVAPLAPPPGTVPVITMGEYRAAQAQFNNLTRGKTFSPDKVKLIGKLLAGGKITYDQVQNLALYNSPLAPAKPEVKLSGNYAMVQQGNSIQFIDMTNGKDPKQAAAAKQAYEGFTNTFQSMVEQGLLPDEGKRDGKSSPNAGVFYTTKMGLTINAMGVKAVEDTVGFPISDERGNFDYSKIPPGKIPDFVNWYVNVETGERNRADSKLVSENIGNAAELLPAPQGGEQILDLTHRFK